MDAAGAVRGEDNRIVTLDIIRGVAVMGILSVNIVDFGLGTVLYLSPAAAGSPDPASLFVWAANLILIDGKMRALFSMLFGASLLLVTDRAEAEGGSAWTVHWRRMVVLLVIGVLHAILIWHGDILSLYAMTGLIAFAFRHAAPGTLIRWGIGLALLHMLVFGAICLALIYVDQAAHAPGATAADIKTWNENAAQFYPSAADLAKTIAQMQSGWPDLVAHHASEAGAIPIMNILLLPETLSLMLIGMAAFRTGLFTGEWHNPRLRRFAARTIAAGVIGHSALVWADVASNFYFATLFGGFVAAMTPFRIAQALGYAALIVLVTRSMGPIAGRVAAVGRTAFTNYLGTSLICTFIFYGWGLGYFGQWSRAEVWLVAPGVWLLMLLWSKPWLERFRYGPLEWLWRSLARLEWQPMRRDWGAQPRPA